MVLHHTDHSAKPLAGDWFVVGLGCGDQALMIQRLVDGDLEVFDSVCTPTGFPDEGLTVWVN